MHIIMYFISIVEAGASSVGIHFTDTKEDANLELEDVYPLGTYNGCAVYLISPLFCVVY